MTLVAEMRAAERNAARIVNLLVTAQNARVEDVASYLGMSRTALYDRLSGRTRFTVGELAVIAKFFEVDPGIFFRDARGLLGISERAAPETRWSEASHNLPTVRLAA